MFNFVGDKSIILSFLCVALTTNRKYSCEAMDQNVSLHDSAPGLGKFDLHLKIKKVMKPSDWAKISEAKARREETRLVKSGKKLSKS